MRLAPRVQLARAHRSTAIVALVVGRAERARIAGALRGAAEVRFCELAAELAEAAGGVGVRTVLAELRDRVGASTAPALVALHTRRPDIAVIGYVTLSTADVRELVALTATAGVRGVVFRDVDDTGAALAATLRVARQTAATTAVLAVVEPVVPRPLWPFFSFCISEAVAPITVAGAAAALKISRRTLDARLRMAKMPGPQRVIGWCRMLHAARLLTDSSDPLEHVAATLEFPSASALHNQLRRYTGLPGAAVRTPAGFALVLDAFVGELRAARPEV